MALVAAASAAPLKPEIRLSRALFNYETVLTESQKQDYHQAGAPSHNAVITLTCEVNNQNEKKKTRRLGSRLTSFLNSVKGFTSVVDLIIGSTGNPIAGAVWGAAKITIQVAAGFDAYFESFSALLMNVGLASPRLEKYALLYPNSPSLRKELCYYFVVVINLCTKVVCFVQKPIARQIASVLQKPFNDEFRSLQKELDRLAIAIKDEIALAVAQQQNQESIEAATERKENSLFRATLRRDHANELVQARKWKSQRLKARLLRSLSCYDHETSLNQARKKGKSTWIFKDQGYEDWRSKDSVATLLCSGIVGSGKTVLAASVVEQLSLEKSDHCSVAYFFCRCDEPATLKAREMIASLARQLLEEVADSAFDAVKSDASLGDITFNLERIELYLLKLLTDSKEYFVILDGIDECDHGEITLFFESYERIQASARFTTKLFFTARSDVVAKVPKRLLNRIHINMSSTNNRTEIADFIQSALEDALESGRLNFRDPGIILNIQDALEKGADGMFLWVVFQIESICAQNTDHDIINCLADLPKGLPATYRRILYRLQQSFSTDVGIGRRIFGMVAAARRPLTIDEMGEALSIVPGDTSWDHTRLINDVCKSLESCGSLLIVDEEYSTIHFAHSSIRSHLLTVPIPGNDIQEYHFDLAQAEMDLCGVVVTYLNLPILDTQLVEVGKHPQSSMTGVPSAVLKSAMPKHDLINRAALALLRSRKANPNGAGQELQRITDGLISKGEPPPQLFNLLSYSLEHWLYHSKFINSFGNDQIHKLWRRLVDGFVARVQLPWPPGQQRYLGSYFLKWLELNPHVPLTFLSLNLAWQELGEKLAPCRSPQYAGSKEIADKAIKILSDETSQRYFKICMERLESLTDVLRRHSSESPLLYDTPPHDILLQQAVLQNLPALVDSLCHFSPARSDIINSAEPPWGGILHTAICCGYEKIVEILVARHANTNLLSTNYGAGLRTARAAIEMPRPPRRPALSLLLKLDEYDCLNDGSPRSPLELAARLQREEIVKILRENGAVVGMLEKPLSEIRKVYGTTLAIARLLEVKEVGSRRLERVGLMPFREDH